MGYGPWYRLGLSLGNCLILVAIIETASTFNSVCHGVAYGCAEYMYGIGGEPPRNLGNDMKANPDYGFLLILYALQVFFDLLLWLVILFKINRHIILVWIVVTISRTCMSSYLDIKEQWGVEFDGATAIFLIFSFLWGTVIFLFKIVTGIQVLVHAVCDEDPTQKLHPAGQGITGIRAHYVENLKQLSVVVLISEIAVNIHRSFNYPETAFLLEAKEELGYIAPSEYGSNISIITIAVDSIGLLLLVVVSKSLTTRRSWIAAYVITILIHFFLFIYVVIDWTSDTAHPQMFNGYVFVSLMHLIYKVVILYIYAKSIL